MRIVFAILLLALSPSLWAQNQSYLYSIEQTPNVIEGWAINPTTGAIVALPNSPFADSGGPFAGATNSGATFLWVVNPSSNSISAYAINTDGSLTEIVGSPFSTGDAQQPSAIAVSLDNQSLYVGSNFSNSNPSNGVLQTYSISANGGLILVNAQVTEPFPVGFVVMPGFLYLGVLSHVDIYNTSSQLPVAMGSVPVSAVASIVGNDSFLFVGGSNGPEQAGGPGMLTTFSINGDGSLTQVAVFNGNLGTSFADLALVPGFLFSNYGTFAIGGDGTITPSPNSAWGPSDPFAISSLPSGPFLFTGTPSTTNPIGLIFPFDIAPDATLTNAEPPLFSKGQVSQFVIATTNQTAPVNPAFVFEPPTSFNFSPLPINTTVVGQISIISTGSVPFDINTISITGDSVFTQTNNCPATLGPKQACFIMVTFAPTAVESYSATLNVTGNVSGSVLLTGSGLAAPPPTLTVTPATQTIQAGGSATFQISMGGGNANPSVSSCPIPQATCLINGMALTVTTTAPTTSAAQTDLIRPPTMIVILAMCILGLCFGNKRRTQTGILAGSLVLLGACGGGSSPATKPGAPVPVTTPGTPSGTYTVAISAGSTSANVQLTVQ